MKIFHAKNLVPHPKGKRNMNILSISSFAIFLFLATLGASSFAATLVDKCIQRTPKTICIDKKLLIQPKVYSTGFDEDSIGLPAGSPWQQYARVWVDGNTTSLTNGTYRAEGRSIFVDNLGRVYVAGNSRGGNPIPNTIDTNTIAKLWIDGNELNLTDGTQSAAAFSVYADGVHSYVVGYESNGNTPIGKVWVDGTVAYNHPNTWLYGVFVVGSDVYYVGTTKPSPTSDYQGRIWKNGFPLPDAQQPSNSGYSRTTASSINIQVTGGIPTIYIGGSTTQSSTKTQATVWKNGVATYLTPVSKQPNGTIRSEVSSVFVKDGNVYAVGHFYENYVQRAKLWKNGVGSTLSAGENDAYATSVFVDAQSNVYVGGVEENVNYANVPNTGIIWKNGAVHFSSLPYYRHSINSVFVK